jgi:DNA-binding IclR family transcriptional regulator
LILAAFTEARPELAIGELAVELGLHKSTVSRLVATLEGRGLVRRVGDRFAPGPELVRLGGLATRGLALTSLAREALRRLAQETGETVNLAVRQGDFALNVHQVETGHVVGVRDWTGRAFPLHCTANGKALLAFGAGPFPDELPALTEWTFTDPTELQEEIDEVRERGYAVAVEELELGLHAVAAPIFDSAGSCIAAVSVSGPSYRLPERRLQAVGATCVSAADEISGHLGFRRAA